MTKVLVVEDSDNARAALVTYLQRLGCCVKSAATGKDAIALGKDFRPDVLICDWILDGPCDGVRVAENLMASIVRPEVIFITAMPLEHLRKRCEPMEVKAFLAKPIDLKVLGLLVDAIRPSNRG
ncbi:MAG: response regulator [Methylococcales bacterium]